MYDVSIKFIYVYNAVHLSNIYIYLSAGGPAEDGDRRVWGRARDCAGHAHPGGGRGVALPGPRRGGQTRGAGGGQRDRHRHPPHHHPDRRVQSCISTVEYAAIN